jgi:predicted oxidoreductase
MDQNVKRLLQEEQVVNQMVQRELDAKNELMKTIKIEAEIAVRAYKRDLETRFTEKVAKVRDNRHRPHILICRIQVEQALNAQDTTGAQGVDMDVLQGEYQANQDEVIAMMIEACMKVDTTIPRVVRGQFD